jgi:hypothetical protein
MRECAWDHRLKTLSPHISAPDALNLGKEVVDQHPRYDILPVTPFRAKGGSYEKNAHSDYRHCIRVHLVDGSGI